MQRQMDYAKQINRKRLDQIHTILHELPAACWDFILSIEDTTSLLTRFAYTYDLRVFFQFVVLECDGFRGKVPKDLTDADIGRITTRDLEWYQHYLTQYISQTQAVDSDLADIEVERTNSEYGKMRKLSSLRSFYSYLYFNKRISANITELVPLPKLHEKPIILLEYDEVARLLDIAESGDKLSDRQQKYHEITKTRDVALLTLLLGTGIRVSECVGIDLDDVNFEENAFIVTRKGGDDTILYFSDEVAKALHHYLDERDKIVTCEGHETALFLSLQRRRITQRAVQNLVKKYAKLAAPLKRKITPHKLRSTFGTHLYHETGDIYLVADVLGHADVNTTRKHYAAQSDERRRLASRSVKLRDDPVKPEKE